MPQPILPRLFLLTANECMVLEMTCYTGTLNEFTPGEASATGGMYDADLMLDVPSSLQ